MLCRQLAQPGERLGRLVERQQRLQPLLLGLRHQLLEAIALVAGELLVADVLVGRPAYQRHRLVECPPSDIPPLLGELVASPLEQLLEPLGVDGQRFDSQPVAG